MGGSSCFLCLGARKEVPLPPRADPHSRSSVAATAAQPFAFDELAAATRNFRDDFRIVRKAILYKGYLKSVKQVVAIKLQHALDPIGSSSEQLNTEFLARVMTLSALRHLNVVNLIGFCADGDHRILVHEYMSLGSLQNHLHDRSPGKALLDWNTRMNIAAGVAKGLEYLHHKGVVYRKPMSSSDILLGHGYHPKLSQYGLAELGQPVAEDDEQLRINVTRTAAIAPETTFTRKATMESNVYSFGGVLLELITGRRPVEPAPAIAEDRNLVIWATRLMDRSQFRRMADPALQGRYPSMDLQEALKVAYMCIHKQPAMRSPIGTAAAALSRLAACDDRPPESSHHAAPR
ncbi:hypothetical protein CFC21_013376 [Triticum aestivum]|uniref:Protein kinase domain-containing protein n=2 Tax=Triticum aestivum TaxID=4565 RepID=A0A9R1DSQ1_WHEAT|nr:probable serine/threonine-protein kinase PBL7 [Triticum aestivum]KAF6997120.1 hypothetical protein CFC21_013376 [Triticum aestivum]